MAEHTLRASSFNGNTEHMHRQGLASRNLIFAAAVSATLIGLMMLKQNHEKWIQSASGVAVTASSKGGTRSFDDAIAEMKQGGPSEQAADPAPGGDVVANKSNSGSTSPDDDNKSARPTAAQRECLETLARGKAFLAEGRAGNAIVLLRKAVELDANCAEAHYHLGLAYSMQGDAAAARRQRDLLQPMDRNLASLLGNLVR